MKYCFLLLVSLLFSTQKLTGQLSIGLTYANQFPFIAEELPDGNVEALKEDNSIMRTTPVWLSYGKGMEYGVQIGYRIRDNFLLGVACSWFDGDRTKSRIAPINMTITQRGMAMRISPYIQTFTQLTSRQNLALYTRVGGIVSLANEFTVNRFQHVSVDIEMEEAFTGGLGFGALGGLGLHYQSSEKLALSIGVKGVFHQYRPHMSQFVKFVVDGVDVLHTLSERASVTKYESEVIIDQNAGPSNEDAPTIAPKQSYPFSSLGVEVGLSYNFSK